MFFKKNNNLKEYKLPLGWFISLPKTWIFEPKPEENQSLAYPNDSDLTFRITPMHAEKHGQLAPLEVMRNAFISTIPSDFKMV
jgi:hypothetical protein